jgi:Flp pilus assembly protein TadG
VVDFALVGGLLTMLFLGVVQLTLVLHVRNTLVDCATEGARFGARADRDPADGADRAGALIAADLGPAYARQVTAARVTRDGLETVEVTVRAPLPVVGPAGPGRALTVSGHALAEGQ